MTGWGSERVNATYVPLHWQHAFASEMGTRDVDMQGLHGLALPDYHCWLVAYVDWERDQWKGAVGPTGRWWGGDGSRLHDMEKVVGTISPKAIFAMTLVCRSSVYRRVRWRFW